MCESKCSAISLSAEVTALYATGRSNVKFNFDYEKKSGKRREKKQQPVLVQNKNEQQSKNNVNEIKRKKNTTQTELDVYIDYQI